MAVLTSAGAVIQALDEFDATGRDAFLAKYGYGAAKRYFVERDGKLYDSKAIYGVAVGYEHPDRGYMRNNEFSGGEGVVLRQLKALDFVIHDTGVVEDGDDLVLPQEEVDAFTVTLRSDEYAAEERNYKVAVHEVVSRLLAPATIKRPEFPQLLAGFFERRLDLANLGIDGALREQIDAAVNGAPLYGVTNAFVNLAGGGFAVNNFIWIPAAIEKGFGEDIRGAFAQLVDPDVDLVQRVEQFRAALYEVEGKSKDAGGFQPSWRLIRISLAFTAALLAAVDPTRYGFYHQGKLKHSFEQFVGPWPSQRGGELYETVCEFIIGVGEALTRQGAPIRDLIDAQSFLYLRASNTAPTGADEPDEDATVERSDRALHLVTKWSPQHGADTVALHQQVADQHGQVWWGVIGSVDRKKISDDNLQRVKAQLEAGTDTYAFVSGPSNVPAFRTRLVDITVDRPADEDLIPSYYPSRLHHSLWLKLADFEPMDHVELMRLLEPNAAPGRLVTLTNQTNPLLVLVRSVPRVWWVNQGSSFRRSREGGYLWAPIADANGTGREHWAALQYARAGDVVINYADTKIRAVSRVTASAYPATRPDPDADTAWTNDGRRIDAEYHDLEHPLDLSAIPEAARRDEGGPFDKNGGVKQAYFFPVSDGFTSLLRNLSPELAALLPTDTRPLSDTQVSTTQPTDPYFEPSFDEIAAAVRSKMALSYRTIRRYHLSLKSRGFVVLSGVSGTGKTWLAQTYATAVNARQLVVPVAPNWTTNEDLLGYLSAITDTYRDTPFSQFLRDASAEWHDAKVTGRTPYPFHVILDEMNLARVEYYFAQFLSVMELRARDGEAQIELAPGDTVTLGPNLVFVGTVNIDETTHLFADKVFDRAQLVELDVDRDALAIHLGATQHAPSLLALFDALADVAPFAYRVVDEISRYITEAEELAVSWEDALDEQIFQKLLPKLKGADPRIGDALEKLIELTTDAYPLSHAKARSMHDGYVQHGFSSYF